MPQSNELRVLIIAPEPEEAEVARKSIVASKVPVVLELVPSLEEIDLPATTPFDVIVMRMPESDTAASLIKRIRAHAGAEEAAVIIWARERDRTDSKELLVNSYVVRSESLSELFAGLRDILQMIRSQ